MVTANNLIEIEVDGPRNEHLHFPPAPAKIRGRFDTMRIAERDGKRYLDDFPHGIPGQLLRLDPQSGEAEIIETLRLPENLTIREKIEERRFGRIPEDKSFTNVHVPTWIYWIKRAVESGIAKVRKGTLPSDIDGEPRKSFLSLPPEKSPNARLADAMERQNELLASIVSRLDRVSK